MQKLFPLFMFGMFMNRTHVPRCLFVHGFFVCFIVCVCVLSGGTNKGGGDKGVAMSKLEMAQRNSIYHIVQFCHFSICLCLCICVSVCEYDATHNRTSRRKCSGCCKISIPVHRK